MKKKPKSSRQRPRSTQLNCERFEDRYFPGDPTGLLQTPLLGSSLSLLSPALLSTGSADNEHIAVVAAPVRSTGLQPGSIRWLQSIRSAEDVASDHEAPLTTHHSPLTTLHSTDDAAPVIIQRKPAVWERDYSPRTSDHSPLTTDHSPLTTDHSPLSKTQDMEDVFNYSVLEDPMTEGLPQEWTTANEADRPQSGTGYMGKVSSFIQN